MFMNRISFWMDQNGVKSKHLAKQCGVSETTFSKWRQNKTQPDLKASAQIAKILGISVDDLIEWRDNE
jgi:transcriptional regulator with XRE-family HTH domain